MREFVTIGVGQAGVRVTQQTVDLYRKEHFLDLEGRPIEQQYQSPHQMAQNRGSHNTFQRNPNMQEALLEDILTSRKSEYLPSFFDEASKGAYRPRCLMVDTDPDSINEIKKSDISKLMSPSYSLSGKHDSSDCYAIGYCDRAFNELLTAEVMGRIRKLVEKCDSFEGFVVSHGLSGGTGSGMGSKLLQWLHADYNKSKAEVINCPIVYSPSQPSGIVEPYNTVLSLHTTVEFSTLTIPFNNHSLFKFCDKQLDIEEPNLHTANQLIVAVIGKFTLQQRKPQSNIISNSIRDTHTNLVPYPRIHYVIPTLSNANTTTPENSQILYRNASSEKEIIKSCYDRRNQLLHSQKDEDFAERGLHTEIIASSLFLEGDFNQKTCHEALREIRQKQPWVDWAPTGLKMGLSSTPGLHNLPTALHTPSSSSSNALSLTSTMEFNSIFSEINMSFDRLYSQRGFLHHFIKEGLEEGDFSEAREDMAALEKDYEVWRLECYDDFEEFEEQ